MKPSSAALLRNRSAGNRSPSLSRRQAPPTGRGPPPARPAPTEKQRYGDGSENARGAPRAAPAHRASAARGSHSRPIQIFSPNIHGPPVTPPSGLLSPVCQPESVPEDHAHDPGNAHLPPMQCFPSTQRARPGGASNPARPYQYTARARAPRAARARKEEPTKPFKRNHLQIRSFQKPIPTEPK